MATFQSSSKSNRLLQSKRYTIANFDGQEAYTNVIDINASEIYTQESSLPTSSLPYSGSSQDGQTILSGSDVIARYYHRIKLTPGNVADSGKYQTWFAISGSDGTAVSPQLVQTNQLKSFLSNKYLAAADASKTAEDNPPGYNVVLSKNDSGDVPADDSILSVNDYQFDYKTGVVQFVGLTQAPSTTAYVYLSGYVYEGQTLDQFISSGGSGGSGTPGGDNTQIQFNDSDAFGGSNRFTFNKTTGLTTLTGSFEISGSDDNIFLIKSGSVNLLRMSSSGALIFGDLQHTPSPVAGGIFYSASAFYVGTE